jgi:hypothetical protein
MPARTCLFVGGNQQPLLLAQDGHALDGVCGCTEIGVNSETSGGSIADGFHLNWILINAINFAFI